MSSELSVTESMTRNAAELARLELSDVEVRTFTTQLGDILNYVAALQSVSVDGVEPLTHPFELETPLREDQVEPFPRDFQQGGYKVPPIL